MDNDEKRIKSLVFELKDKGQMKISTDLIILDGNENFAYYDLKGLLMFKKFSKMVFEKSGALNLDIRFSLEHSNMFSKTFGAGS